MEKQTNLSIIRDRIRQSEYGTVYVAVDFVDIPDKTNINAYLARLAEEGLIRRVMRGVYYKAEYNEMLGEYVTPTVDETIFVKGKVCIFTIHLQNQEKKKSDSSFLA